MKQALYPQTSRVKVLTGEYILTLDPPKHSFDIYVKHFGFFNEVYVEDVIKFARENYPYWESWLLKHGIPFKEEEIKVGDIVEVVDITEQQYEHNFNAKRMGAKRYVKEKSKAKTGDIGRVVAVDSSILLVPETDETGRVVAIGQHQHIKRTVVLVDLMSEEILIGIKGLRRIR